MCLAGLELQISRPWRGHSTVSGAFTSTYTRFQAPSGALAGALCRASKALPTSFAALKNPFRRPGRHFRTPSGALSDTSKHLPALLAKETRLPGELLPAGGV